MTRSVRIASRLQGSKPTLRRVRHDPIDQRRRHVQLLFRAPAELCSGFVDGRVIDLGPCAFTQHGTGHVSTVGQGLLQLRVAELEDVVLGRLADTFKRKSAFVCQREVDLQVFELGDRTAFGIGNLVEAFIASVSSRANTTEQSPFGHRHRKRGIVATPAYYTFYYTGHQNKRDGAP